MGSGNSRKAPGAACRLGIVVLAAGFAPAQAGTSDDPAIDEIVVTATRTPTSIDSTLSPTSVLTQLDIEQQQALSFQDLMRGQPGIQISNNGGMGKTTNLFLRGTNANHVLVLVDGVRIGSSTLGTTAFQYLPMDSIGRIEIVRGPLSSLYGSEAVGGVIQIFTRRAPADGTSFEADASGGSHDTSSISSRLGGSYAKTSFNLSASNLSTDGYPNCTGAPYESPSSPGGGCYVYDTANDGYHNVSGTARLRYEITEGADVEAFLLRSQGGTRYAGPYTNHQRFAEQAASLAAHWSPIDSVKLTMQLGQSSDNELESLDGISPPGSLFDTTRRNASFQADWKTARSGIVTLGVDYLRDAIATDAEFSVTSRNTTGVFGEYQLAFGREEIAASVRRDHNTQFGDRTTGSAAWGHKLTQSLKLLASYGTAFHAPSFNDLYYPYFGNPALKPETSRSTDLGIEQRFSSANWSVHAFETRLENLIAYNAVLFAPENIEEARIRGAELAGELRRDGWSLGLAASWLDARNQTPGGSAYDNLLPRRARWTGRINLAREWTRFRAAMLLDSSGRRFDDLANTQPLGGFVTADLQLEWTPVPAWTIQAKMANALDRRYEYARYFPQDRRNYLLTVRYRPATLR